MVGTGTKSKTGSAQMHSLHSGTGSASATGRTGATGHAAPTWSLCAAWHWVRQALGSTTLALGS